MAWSDNWALIFMVTFWAGATAAAGNDSCILTRFRVALGYHPAEVPWGQPIQVVGVLEYRFLFTCFVVRLSP